MIALHGRHPAQDRVPYRARTREEIARSTTDRLRDLHRLVCRILSVEHKANGAHISSRALSVAPMKSAKPRSDQPHGDQFMAGARVTALVDAIVPLSSNGWRYGLRNIGRAHKRERPMTNRIRGVRLGSVCATD